MVYNSNTGTSLPDVLTRTTIVLQAEDGEGNVVKSLYFKGAKLKGIKVGTVNPSTGEPLRLTLDWIFTKAE